MAERKIFAGGEFLITDAGAEDVFILEEMTREHKMIYAAAFDFVKKEIRPNMEKINEKNEELTRSLIKKAGDLGLIATDIPEEYGGEEMDKISTCLVTDAIGGGASFSVSHSAHTGIGTLPIVYFGTEAQKKKYLPKLGTGEWLAAYCLTESSAGSDALNAQTTATLSDDGRHYLLNGEKVFITNGAWADLFIVYAKVDGEKFTGFIVERSFPGVSSGPEEKKMGIEGSSTTSVIFKDCMVPVENVLFEIGQGHKIAFNVLNIGRYKLGAGVIGGCKVIIAEATQYATTREQFGKKIASFGMIKNKLADMCIGIFMTESLTYRLAAMIEDKLSSLDPQARKEGAENAKAIEEYAAECSIAKVYGSECLDFCADEVVQIFGGYGYIAEYPAEGIYRDARINRIFEGTNEINRLLITGTVLKRAVQGRLALFDAVQALEEEVKAGLPDAPGFDDAPLAAQQHQVKMSKKILLLTLGKAAGNLLADLAEEQEVLAFLSDMITEIFAMESGLLRALKMIDKKGEKRAEYHTAAVQIYINDVIPKIVHWSKQVLTFVEKDDALVVLLVAVDKLAAYRPVDTVSLRRLIAEKVIKSKKYIF
ncbi:MAG: acyl-CoA dehydrogenase family protein [Desulfobacterales bacterium]|uniref:Acyl-CoA dehydrogenase family protein n=1 Tax=Candidatus Desulfatibia vada TaxID=2841696 RepID=A0A8J6TP59_9BACT|nr:acyl-CoA dehydrogenase family protein [Candidatus Desulfatibia vada]